jgi:hypothetical protein
MQAGHLEKMLMSYNTTRVCRQPGAFLRTVEIFNTHCNEKETEIINNSPTKDPTMPRLAHAIVLADVS